MQNEANEGHVPNSLNQVEAEVIVHSDFSASHRDCASSLHMLDMEEGILSEEHGTEHHPPESQPGQPSPSDPRQHLHPAAPDQEGRMEAEPHETLLRTERPAGKTGPGFPASATALSRVNQGLNSVPSEDFDSCQEGGDKAQPTLQDTFPAGQPRVLLCGGLSSIIGSPSGFENVACVHQL